MLRLVSLNVCMTSENPGRSRITLSSVFHPTLRLESERTFSNGWGLLDAAANLVNV